MERNLKTEERGKGKEYSDRLSVAIASRDSRPVRPEGTVQDTAKFRRNDSLEEKPQCNDDRPERIGLGSGV